MARKYTPKKSPTAADADSADNPLEDLYVAMPDVPLDLAGRKLTVREYRFIDGMRARAKAGPLIDDLQQFVDDGGAQDAGVEAYMDLLAKHETLVRELMADSIEGADADFIDGLSGLDGERLLMAWWSVSGRFFWRAVVGRLRDRTLLELRRREQEARSKAATAGGRSFTPSFKPDTEISSTSSPASPSDK